MKLAALILFGLSIFSWAAAPMPEVTRTIVSPAVVLAVHDGDTVSLAVTGHRTFVSPVRMLGVLAKELATVDGQKAKAHLAELLPIGKRVRVSLSYTDAGHPIESLCRPLATIWIESTGVNVNESHTKYLKAHNLWGGNQ